jgi:nucleoside-diphosphate-sugar epimerase
MSDRIAVTGASGFVGRHLTLRASTLGWDVVGLVRREAADRVVRQAGGRPVRPKGPEPEAWAPALEGARAVVHLAQIGAERGGATYEAVNIGLTQRLTAAARQAGVPRIIYFSGLGVAHYGLVRRCTNPYFLSKLAAEVELYRSDREAVVFRPSYIVGPGDTFVAARLAEMAKGVVEQPGDGAYRLQPIAVGDAVALVLAAALRPPSPRPTVLDLVGPEPVSYAELRERLARVARGAGRAAHYRVHERPIPEVDRLASAGGYRGLSADEVDCLLCDEISDPAPLEAFMGRSLTPLDDALAAAVGAG